MAAVDPSTLFDYNTSANNQLQQINAMGTVATQRAQQIAAARAAAIAAAAQNVNPNNATGNYNTKSTLTGAVPNYKSGQNTFANFLHAISGRESGGNYNAVNRDSGALGKYQVMPGNVASWSKEALGHSVSTSTYLHSPKIQEQVAQYQLKKYYNKWGPGGAAVAWYAGPGAAPNWMKSHGQGSHWNAPQGHYSSISAYAYGILKAMGLM